MQRSDLLRKTKWLAALLGLFIVVFLVSVIFLNPSSVGNARFGWNISLWAVIWTVNFIIVVILLFVLARNLIKLFFEYQGNRPGSRIKSKLVMTLTMFSLFPALIMSFLAFGLINRNLRQWASSPYEQLLGSSKTIASHYYQQRRELSLAAAQFLAGMVDSNAPKTSPAFESAARAHGFDAVQLFDAQGRLNANWGRWASPGGWQSGIEAVLQGSPFYLLERRIAIDEGVVGIPLYGADHKTVRGALFAHFTVPESITFHAIQVETAARSYEEIRRGVRRFQINYFGILAFTTLGVIVGFVWLGTYIAKRITIPLEALAAGSRELAGGNLDHRVDVKAVDELGILVNSFNRMGSEIKQSRLELEHANAELRETNVLLEQRRKYTETILQNIATGVLSIDDSDIVHSANEPALKMLKISREEILNRSIQEVVDPDLFRQFQAMKKRAGLYGSHRAELTLRRGERQLHIAATITSIPPQSRELAAYLVVLDDLTELIKSEKFAAWQEVARRLAHEIKNPLTPIQLSAERVKKRFDRIARSRIPGPEFEEFGRVVTDATRIIVSEAGMLKSMVTEFSRFARLPMCKPTSVDLHELIDRTLSLYDGGLGNVRVDRVFDQELTKVKVDPEQMQRVLINLIDNSLDALAERDGDRRILIRTRFDESRGSVTLIIEDNGAGIPLEDYEHLFLPYFSTKKKGTGLGLAIVRQIVSEHNGFVRAEPNQPEGTRFVIELPLGYPELE